MLTQKFHPYNECSATGVKVLPKLITPSRTKGMSQKIPIAENESPTAYTPLGHRVIAKNHWEFSERSRFLSSRRRHISLITASSGGERIKYAGVFRSYIYP